jgi:hypothetical protein
MQKMPKRATFVHPSQWMIGWLLFSAPNADDFLYLIIRLLNQSFAQNLLLDGLALSVIPGLMDKYVCSSHDDLQVLWIYLYNFAIQVSSTAGIHSVHPL